VSERKRVFKINGQSYTAGSVTQTAYAPVAAPPAMQGAEARIQALMQEARDARGALIQAEEKVQTLGAERDHLTQALGAANDKVSQLQAELRKQVDSAQLLGDERALDAERRFDAAQTALLDTQRQLKDLSGKYERASVTIAELNKRIEDLQAEQGIKPFRSGSEW
jgi:chromosome segregation ATPase